MTLTASQIEETAFTFDKLMQAVEKLKSITPIPILCASKHFPAEKALVVKRKKGDVWMAHHDFWAKLPVQPASSIPMFGALQIIDVDLHPHRMPDLDDIIAYKEQSHADGE